MTQRQTLITWALVLAVFIVLLSLLSEMLLPFVAAMAVAYFLDPVADRLERLGLSRTMATTVITALFFLVVILAFLILVPVLAGQFSDFQGRLPGYIDGFRERFLPTLQAFAKRYGIPLQVDVKSAIGNHATEALAVLRELFLQLLGGGQAVLSLLSLIVVTPVVSFYLLRDWDRMVQVIDGLLPLEYADTIRSQANAIDAVLAGFVRGQTLVCLSLGVFYGIGLSLIGLDFGLVIGIGAGLISFIPYVGTLSGLVVAMFVSFVQFGTDWRWIAATAAVFGIGQFLEGNFLTPKLVGDRIGLHPVWIMFGLIAGAALFGFVGILIAVPACAVIGVLTRFFLGRYRLSSLYSGIRPPDQR